jgi:hypothetical protein
MDRFGRSMGSFIGKYWLHKIGLASMQTRRNQWVARTRHRRDLASMRKTMARWQDGLMSEALLFSQFRVLVEEAPLNQVITKCCAH